MICRSNVCASSPKVWIGCLPNDLSILKKAQGEKIAPYVFKINDTQTLQEYLDKEKITYRYKIYQEEQKIINNKRTLTQAYDEPRKKQKLEEI